MNRETRRTRRYLFRYLDYRNGVRDGGSASLAGRQENDSGVFTTPAGCAKMPVASSSIPSVGNSVALANPSCSCLVHLSQRIAAKLLVRIHRRISAVYSS